MISTTGIMNVTKGLILTPYLTFSNGTTIDATQKFEPYGYRTMGDIIRTCALTVFACTWATIHPNIPSHRCSPSKLHYKLHLWIVNLIMPELLLLWAAKQYLAARKLAKKKGMSRRCFPRPCSPQNVSDKRKVRRHWAPTPRWEVPMLGR